MSLINKVEQFNDDVDIAHQIVHGDATTTVPTEGGPVRSLAKLIADKDAEFVGGDVVQQAVAARNGSEAARDIAELARDAAFVNADVKDSVTDGLAGPNSVEIGEQFQTLSEDGLGYIRYRKDSESVATEVARNLSPDGVREEAHSAVEKLGIYVTRDDLAGEVYSAALLGSNEAGDPAARGLYSTSNSEARSVIFDVHPGVTYTVAKTPSNRFRVAEFNAEPTEGMTASLYTKDGNVPEELDGTMEYFTFTTQQDTSLVVVFVSGNGETPDVAMYPGEYQRNEPKVINTKETVFENKVTISQPLTAANIVRGKNLFVPTVLPTGVHFAGGLGNPLVQLTASTITPNAVTAYCEIEPDEVYTVSKTTSNRFRVALSSSEPALGETVRIIAGEENDGAQSFTFDSGPHRYLILYLSTTGSMPEFVQLEKGIQPTPFEAPGYKLHPMAESPLEKDVYLYSQAGVGNANYISKAAGTEGAWANPTFTIPANDDTEELQEAFNMANGIVSLDPGKKYRITSTIVVDIARVKTIQGNMATIVVDGDFEAIHWKGTHSGNAGPGSVGSTRAYNEMSPLITGLRITSPMEVTGTGIVLEGCMAPIISNCSIKYLKRGIVFRGINRNVNINNCNIYACHDYGIHFEEGGDLHQVIIANSHISYCRKNIFGENQHLYNVQIIGCDIETSSYPPAAEHNIEFLQTTATLEDLKIVGNTIEDHFNTNALIRIFGGASTDRVRNIEISGNVIGNSADAALQIGGIGGIYVSGSFKMNVGPAIDVVERLNNAVININSDCYSYGGGLLRAIGDFAITSLNMNGSVCSGVVSQQPVLIDVHSIVRSSLSNMILYVRNLELQSDGSFPAPLSVKANTVPLLRVDNNTIDSYPDIETAIDIDTLQSSAKGSMCGNMSSRGTFNAPSSFMIDGNL